MRERLVELIKHDNCISPATCSSKCKYVDLDDCHSERLADLILADGWIRLPCKVGQTVYKVCKRKYDVDGYGMQWVEDWGILNLPFRVDMIDQIGKTVFLTKEEAEQALKAVRSDGLCQT